MSRLEDISERLLSRSREAIIQLELWVQRQQQIPELENEDCIDRLADQYNIYIAQLNSLCVRSEYVRHRLNEERQRRLSMLNDHKYIEDLVYEFQGITVKLNELAQTQKSDSTPSSKSTQSSLDSFQPRPLKITERHLNNVQATLESPIKKNLIKKRVNFVPPNKEVETSKCISLPGSPIRELSIKRSIRLAKSCDTALNSNAQSKTKKQHVSDLQSFFKENQRLSISFFEDRDDDLDSMSDQDTVISMSPSRGEKFKPLRRYKSHESILSTTKVQPISSGKTFAAFLLPSSNRPSMKSVRVSSAPVFSSTGTPTCSRDLLSAFVESPHNPMGKKESRNKLKSSSFFGKWNFFSTSPVRTPKINMRQPPSCQKTVASEAAPICGQLSHSSCSHLVFKSDESTLPPASQPIFDSMVSYDDLRDALNTELILRSD